MGMFKATYLVLFLSIVSFSVSYKQLSQIYNNSQKPPSNEVLYLPKGKGLKFMSFGYRNVLAHTLWFNTISYFGKHFKSDRNYEWLGHMCGLVTDLNPKMLHVYDFCSLMLAWEANLPDQNISLLDKGIAANPLYWKLPYLRGMTYLIFKNEPEKARDDFILSSKLPESPELVKSLPLKTIILQRIKIVLWNSWEK